MTGFDWNKPGALPRTSGIYRMQLKADFEVIVVLMSGKTSGGVA